MAAVPTVQRHSGRTLRVRGDAAVIARNAWLRKHPLCAMCMRRGVLTPGTEVDHIIPLFKGGLDVAVNKQTLCAADHKLKTAADLGKARHPGSDISGEPIGGWK